MRSGFASLVVVGVAACVAVYALTGAPASSSLYHTISASEMEFIKYIASYGKSYGTKEEFEFRAQIFKNTLQTISDANSENGASFSLGLNRFADMTPEEYKMMFGYKATRGSKLQNHIQRNSVSIPTEVDWRNNGAVNPVKDQGSCGSCWAFSGISSLESHWQIKSGNLLSLSEQQAVDCATGAPYESEGCNGGWMDDVFEYGKANGIELGSDYPYVGRDQTCDFDASKVAVKTTGHHEITANNANAHKQAIALGPISVALDASSIFFQFYKSGVMNNKNCGTQLNHGVVAVGYGNDASKGDYYIVRNSWGAGWGDKGYIKIAIIGDGPGLCGIQMKSSYPLL